MNTLYSLNTTIPHNKLRRWSSLVFLVLLPALTQAQTIFTVAGNGNKTGYDGDGKQATSVAINYPRNIATDNKGNIYFADTANYRIRKVDINGIISTVAGNGTNGYTGDEGLATNASISWATDVALDSKGNLYICDTYNHVIRKVDVNTNIITKFAGTNPTAGYNLGDGGPATSAYFYYPYGIAFDAADNLYVAEQTMHHRIRKISPEFPNIITTVAGNGNEGDTGDGGLATDATLGTLWDVAVDKKTGDIYIADSNYYKVRKVTASTGKISTVAGTGVQPYNNGDGGPATNANIDPMSLDVDSVGNLYITDWHNEIIRKVTPVGIISTVAGMSNTYNQYIDGKAALGINLYVPFGMAVDASGKVLVADTNRIFKITTVDNKSDVVWRDSVGNNMIWFSANSTTPKTLTSRSDTNWKIATVADFNGDGSKDLLWRYSSVTPALIQDIKKYNNTTGTGGTADPALEGVNEIWLSGESSTGMALSLSSQITDWIVAGAGNFDGNSTADIVWRNIKSGLGENQIWYDGKTPANLTAIASANWKIVGISDFNGDKIDDLLWRNSSTGANTIWLSGNSNTLQTVATQTTAWSVAGAGNF